MQIGTEIFGLSELISVTCTETCWRAMVKLAVDQLSTIKRQGISIAIVSITEFIRERTSSIDSLCTLVKRQEFF